MAERRRSAHAIDDQNNGGTLSAKKTRDPLSSYLYRSVRPTPIISVMCHFVLINLFRGECAVKGNVQVAGRVFIDRLRKTFAGTKSALVIG